MKVQQSNISLASGHCVFERETRQESLKFWVGERPSANSDGANPNAASHASGLLSQSTHTQSQKKCDAQVDGTQKAKSDEEEAALSPLLRTIKAIVEKMFGQKIKLMVVPKGDGTSGGDAIQTSQSQADAGPARAGWGMEYDCRETRLEYESMDFSAKGLVRTSDGREIQFDLSIQMERSFCEENHVQVRAGDALVDPLVINFDGQAVQLANRNFQFDLNADGQKEQIAMVKAGSAFLALDKDQDGVINDGKELFGPTTGHGFNELAAYDQDHNNWIDDNDPIFSQLRLWSQDAEGQMQLSTLKEKQVGAIYLQNTSTPFVLKDANQQTTGEVATSGVCIFESGTVGAIQQVNLVA